MSEMERLFMSDAILCLRPDLRGAVSMVELKVSRVIQESTRVGSDIMVEIAEISSLAQCVRADRGICLMTAVAGGSEIGVDLAVLAHCEMSTVGIGLKPAAPTAPLSPVAPASTYALVTGVVD